ncbi:MAG: DUF6754 domain-containing protein, partial [Nitrospirota bacterium]
MGKSQKTRELWSPFRYALRITRPPSRGFRRTGHASLLTGLLFLLAWAAPAMAAELSAPHDVSVIDTPSDSGGGLTILWSKADYDGPDVRYQILMGEGAEKKMVAEFPANSHYVRDAKFPWWTRPAPRGFHQYDIKTGKGIELKDGTAYAVSVAVRRGDERAEAPAVQVVPEPNWVNWNQMNNLLLVLLFGAVVFGSIRAAKRREIFLRRIPGLDAVDEAIGRATELGKPILYLTGAGDMSEPATIAAAVILGRVAKRVAAYETD